MNEIQGEGSKARTAAARWGQEPPREGRPYRRVLCARCKDRDGGGLRGSGRGKAKGRSKVEDRSPDPTKEAGAPSTEGLLGMLSELCPPHRG